MKQLYEVLRQRKQPGDFGIEVEVEGRDLPYLNCDVWKTEEDGSLRDGLEYVVKGAIAHDDVEASLKRLEGAFIDEGSRVEFTFRTSVHVHMNMQKLTVPQVFNCIYTYLLLEDALMEYCGEQRKANRFCLRAADAEFSYDVYEALFAAGDNGFDKIPHNKARYSAINVEALSKYGSLEFRGMEGNMDIPRLVRWCSALLAIRNYAQKHETPMDIYKAFDNQTPEAFLVSVLGPLSKSFKFPGMDRSFKRSFSLAISLPFAFRDGARKRKLQEAKDNNLALKLFGGRV